VVAVALGWWLLDETVGWSLVIGTVLVCAGVLLVNVRTTPQTGAGTSEEDLVATGRQR
jgi:drug/metabolite transporter (DMT)-like permease